MREQKQFGQALPGWSPPPHPKGDSLLGHYVALEALNADLHSADLLKASLQDDAVWDYLPYGPFHSTAAYHRWVRSVTEGVQDPLFYAIRDRAHGKAAGVASYLRITPEAGSIEVGHINFSPQLQGTRAATEAMVLMMQWAFDAGYRRYEWKCDALNIPSRRAAQRLGFSYEGTFRQHTIYRGRNRDTAWYSIIDREWPALREAYRAWLAPSNFDAEGRQVERLSDLTLLVRAVDDPALL